jgi:DNA-binding response OmpR family regulator
MAERILIVEDEEKMARMVELELVHEGYEADKAGDGISGLELAEREDFDLILLDIMLPGLSGIEVLRRLRKSKPTPVILLTARDEVVDKVLGLDSGADDYITKPFVIEELLARIRAALRKSAVSAASAAAAAAATTTSVAPSEGSLLQGSGNHTPGGSAAAESASEGSTAHRFEDKKFTAGKLLLDVDRHRVTYDGETIELTLKEFDLLQCLLENKGRVLTRDALLDRVWGYDYIGETNAVDVYVRFLRSKIDEVFDLKLISTVRGVGYRIEDDT